MPGSKDERRLVVDGCLDPVVFGPFNIILSKKVEPKAVLFRIDDVKELGPESDPKGLRHLTFENAELDPLTKAQACLGDPSQPAAPLTVQGSDVIGY